MLEAILGTLFTVAVLPLFRGATPLPSKPFILKLRIILISEQTVQKPSRPAGSGATAIGSAIAAERDHNPDSASANCTRLSGLLPIPNQRRIESARITIAAIIIVAVRNVLT